MAIQNLESRMHSFFLNCKTEEELIDSIKRIELEILSNVEDEDSAFYVSRVGKLPWRHLRRLKGARCVEDSLHFLI